MTGCEISPLTFVVALKLLVVCRICSVGLQVIPKDRTIHKAVLCTKKGGDKQEQLAAARL